MSLYKNTRYIKIVWIEQVEQRRKKDDDDNTNNNEHQNMNIFVYSKFYSVVWFFVFTLLLSESNMF